MTDTAGCWTDTNGTKFREIGGVLRNTTGIWTILNDATHKSLNLTSVTANTKAIYLTIPQGLWIGPFLVTADETYSSLGIFCGASVTQNLAIISVYHTVSGKVTLVNPLTLKTALGNLWIMGRQFVS